MVRACIQKENIIHFRERITETIKILRARLLNMTLLYVINNSLVTIMDTQASVSSGVQTILDGSWEASHTGLCRVMGVQTSVSALTLTG